MSDVDTSRFIALIPRHKLEVIGISLVIRVFAVRMFLAGVGLGALTSVAAPATAARTNKVVYVRVSDIPKKRITRIVVQKTWPMIERTIDMTTNTISATVRVRSYNRWEKTYKYSGLTVAIAKLCRSDLRKVAETKDLSDGGFTEHIDIYTGEKVVFSGYLYHRDSDSTAGNLKCKGIFLPEIEPVWLDVALTEVETKMCDE